MDRQCAYNVTLKSVCVTIVAVEKQLSIMHSECVFVALSIQHTMFMPHVVICCLPGSNVFSHIILQTAGFSKAVIEHKTCVSIFSIILSVTFLILRRNGRDIITRVQ
jgi:hypothetical protein